MASIFGTLFLLKWLNFLLLLVVFKEKPKAEVLLLKGKVKKIRVRPKHSAFGRPLRRLGQAPASSGKLGQHLEN